MSQWDVVGVGANSVDYVYRLPAYPEPEGPRSKLRISGHRISCGGQIATTLSTCAAMGLRTKYVGAVGADGNGQRLRAELHHRGIDTASVVERDALNAYAVILIADDVGERVVLWDRSDALALAPEELPVEAIASARALHVDDVDQHAGIAAARIGRDAGVLVTSDIDRATAGTEELIATVSIPIFAEHRAAGAAGKSDQGVRAEDPPGARPAGSRRRARVDAARGDHLRADARPPVDTTGQRRLPQHRSSRCSAATLRRHPALRERSRRGSCTRDGAVDGVEVS
jgi:sugar/nucleoside kinase (ribokinase family)